MKRLIGLKYWILAAFALMGGATFMAYQQHCATLRFKSHHASYCTAASDTKEKELACLEESENAKDYLAWWYALLAWPEGITAWAVIATGAFIAWQAVETRNAARAATKASETALKQIEHAIIAERAWMTVSEVTPEAFIGGIDPFSKDTKDGVQFRFTCTNAGNTPAMECFVHCALQIASSHSQIPTFTPPAVDAEHIPMSMIAPGRIATGMNLQVLLNQIEAVRTGGHRLFLYCRISYKTVNEPSIRCTTEVCVEAIPDGSIQATGAINWRLSHVGPQNTAT